MAEPAVNGTRPPLEAVIFDAGGTLVRIDYEWIAEMLGTHGLTVTADEVRRGELHGRRRYDATARAPKRLAPGEPHPPLGSAGDTRAYFTGMLEAVGCRAPLLEEALDAFAAKQRPPGYLWGRAAEGAREAIDALRGTGLRLACVSNSDGRAEAHLVDTGTRDGLEFVVDSQIVGVEKPDPHIFEIALERLDVPAERALYVGDIRSVDEVGARGAGLRFVLLDPSGTYAGPDTAWIASIAELPKFVSERFTIVVPEGRSPN